MAEFIKMTTPDEGLLENLQQNLGDRYTNQFSIIQEILQNADDAGATKVHFGYLQNFRTEHPLTAGPCLYAINNGNVRKEDIEHIHYVGLGTKTDAVDKIGRFGYGMKSVFHICDAFFLCASGHDEVPRLDFCMPPWNFEHGQHSEWVAAWKDMSDEAVRNWAQAFSNALPQHVKDNWKSPNNDVLKYFGVLIPCRRARSQQPFLTNEFCENPNELLNDGNLITALRMLPLLKHVQELSFDKRCFSLQGTQMRTVPTEENAQMDQHFEGKISTTPVNANAISYAGRERLMSDEKFTGLRNSEIWPSKPAKTSDGQDYKKKNKTFAHASICIVNEACQSGMGCVNLFPCAFLPLNCVHDIPAHGNENFSFPIGQDRIITINLHGFFFVDAGRKDVEIPLSDNLSPQNEQELKREWNRRIWRLGTLPMLVGELNRAVEQFRWDDALVTEVVSKIVEWPRVRTHLSAVLNGGCFAHVLTQEGFRWQMILPTAGVKFIRMAEVQTWDNDNDVRELVLSVLPDQCCVIDGASAILPQDDSGQIVERFPDDMIISILGSIAQRDDATRDKLLRNDRLYHFVMSQLVRQEGTSLIRTTQIDFAVTAQEIKDLKFWRIEGCRYSYSEVLQIRGKLYLGWDNGMRVLLRQVTNGVEILQLDASLGRALNIVVDSCTNDFISRNISSGGFLTNNLNARAQLIQRLLSQGGNVPPVVLKACRYLAHGQAQIIDRLDRIYIFPHAGGAWQWVVSNVNRIEFGTEVSIPDDILTALNDDQKRQLGFADCSINDAALLDVDNKASLINRVSQRLNDIDFATFPQDGWCDLVNGLREPNRCEGLKRLPIFPTNLGLRPLEESTRVDEYAVPNIFAQDVPVLQLENVSEHLVATMRMMKQPWKPSRTVAQARRRGYNAITMPSVIAEALCVDNGHELIYGSNAVGVVQDDLDFILSSPWVKLRTGCYVSPRDILDVQGLPAVDGLYSSDLIECEELRRVLRAGNWVSMRNENRVVRLFEILAMDGQYAIDQAGDVSASNLVQVFEDTQRMPVVQFLRCLQEVGVEVPVGCLDGLKRQNIPNERLVLILNYLTERLQARQVAVGATEESIRNLLFAYLDVAARRQNFRTGILSKIMLRSLTGCSLAGELFWPDEIIPQDRTLDVAYYRDAPGFFHAVEDIARGEMQCGNPEDNHAQGDYVKLHEYFRDNLNPDCYTLAAGFIIACSNDEDDLKWAREHGIGGEIQNARTLLSPSLHNYLRGWYRNLQDDDQDVEGDNDHRCLVNAWQVDLGNAVQKRSLTGVEQQFVAQGLDQAETLFNGIRYGRPDFVPRRMLLLNFRRISQEERNALERRRIAEILKSTLIRILIDEFSDRNRFNRQFREVEPAQCRCEGISEESINRYWEGFFHSEQLTIEVTKSVILGSVHDYLQVIGCGSLRLKGLCKQLGDRHVDMVRARQADPDPGRLQETLRSMWDVEEEIGQEILENADLQGDLLGALRQKMTTYGYSIKSLLFELLQNADDASEELVRCWPREGGPDRFVVRFDAQQKRLVVVHYGRPINRHCSGHDEFGRDLEKMIKMFQSDKQQGDNTDVVGKFGLGFKTVFLVSDTPYVFSGDLRFKIIGGLLPSNLSDEEKQELMPIYNDYANAGGACSPTVIVLPIRDGEIQGVRDAVNAFKMKLAYLAAFTKRIKKIQIEEQVS